MAILNEWTLDFISSSVEQTVRLGIRLGELLQANDVLCLSGNLGAGKTALAQGVGRGWGTSIRVTSPSYVLINEYPRQPDGLILYHVDCYRLENQLDIVTVGLEDIFNANCPVMIEWPERIKNLLPEDRFWIEMEYESATRRKLRFIALGLRSAELLNNFKRSAFGV